MCVCECICKHIHIYVYMAHLQQRCWWKIHVGQHYRAFKPSRPQLTALKAHCRHATSTFTFKQARMAMHVCMCVVCVFVSSFICLYISVFLCGQNRAMRHRFLSG